MQRDSIESGWQPDFEGLTHCEPSAYRRDLLENLDTFKSEIEPQMQRQEQKAICAAAVDVWVVVTGKHNVYICMAPGCLAGVGVRFDDCWERLRTVTDWKGNPSPYTIDLQKLQKNPIFHISVDISRTQTSLGHSLHQQIPFYLHSARSLLHDNIVPKPDLALELGKSISLTEAEEEAVAREVHATHARIVSESEPEPTQRRQSGIAFRDSFIVSKKRSSDSSKKLKGIQTLTPAEQEAADIMKALKESKKMSKRQPGTGGSNEGTGNILGVPDESTVVSRASSEGTGSKPGVPDEEKLILEWEADVDSEHFDRDDNAGDDNEETGAGDDNADPAEIYKTRAKLNFSNTIYPVAIVASRAVDPVGSPSSTTIDQDEQSTSTSPTNQEIQSQVTHQGPVPQFMAPDHSSSGPVLHEMTSDQIRSDLTPNRQETSVDNISSDLVSNKQKASDYDIFPQGKMLFL
ncbi:hypothetical protein Tco_0615889 [Tanacetum coccineum]